MRDPERRKRVLQKIGELWERPGYGDMRLGQLISVLAPADADLFYFEDDKLEAVLDAWSPT